MKAIGSKSEITTICSLLVKRGKQNLLFYAKKRISERGTILMQENGNQLKNLFVFGILFRSIIESVSKNFSFIKLNAKAAADAVKTE